MMENFEYKFADLICNPPDPTIKMLLGYYNDDVNLNKKSSCSTKAINAFIALRFFFVCSNLARRGRNIDVTHRVVVNIHLEFYKILTISNPLNIDIDYVMSIMEHNYFYMIDEFGFNIDSEKEAFFSSLPYIRDVDAMEKIFEATRIGIDNDVRYILSEGKVTSSSGCGCILPVLIGFVVVLIIRVLFRILF